MYSQFQEFSPRIVLLACGSFSPPTLMHLRMFEIARDHIDMMGIGKVIGGIVSPVHDLYGKNGLAPAKHRLAMLKLSLQSSDWIKMSDWECNQNQWSRTRQTLQYHQNYMNNLVNEMNDLNNQNLPGWIPDSIKGTNEKIQLKLLCGADLLESFAVPGLWAEDDIEEIVGNFGIVVISRSGGNPEKFIFDSDILTKYQTNITIVRNWVPNEVSSSMIRRLLKRGQSVKYLIDDLVLQYIQTHGLFDVKIPEYHLDNYHKRKYISNKNYLIENYINEIDLKSQNNTTSLIKHQQQQDNIIIEQMDETDYSNNKRTLSDLRRSSANVFCCKGNDNNNSDSKFTLNCPGQAVKIITNPLHIQERRNEHDQRIIELNKANTKKLRMNNNDDNGFNDIDTDNDRNLVRCDKEAVNFI